MKELTKTKKVILTITILYESVFFLLCLIGWIFAGYRDKSSILFTMGIFLFFSVPLILYWLGVWIYNLLGKIE